MPTALTTPGGPPLMSTTTETKATADTAGELTDGYHLVVDALKLNDVQTIYGVGGIPITDVAPAAREKGNPVIGFRPESVSRPAGAGAGVFMKRRGVCLAC